MWSVKVAQNSDICFKLNESIFVNKSNIPKEFMVFISLQFKCSSHSKSLKNIPFEYVNCNDDTEMDWIEIGWNMYVHYSWYIHIRAMSLQHMRSLARITTSLKW